MVATADWRVVVMATSASSTIEDEGLPPEIIDRLIAMTEPGEHVNDELRQRIASQKDIAQAYLWLLNLRANPIVSKSMIQSVHRKMFQRTQKDIAGSYKARQVVIRWHKPDGTIERVPTLPPEKVGDYLGSLCDETSAVFSREPFGNLLAAAEFSCDFLAIHPFSDGNGRLARMLCGYLLQQADYHLIGEYPLEQIILETRHRYYDALNHSQSFWHRENENLEPWIKYFIEILSEHCRRAKRAKETRQEQISQGKTPFTFPNAPISPL